MLNHGFDMYRVFISGPGDLERDREVCRATISEVNASEAMPYKILLVSVGLQSDDQITGFRSLVADNVRQCTYFIQLFQDDWGPKNLFRKTFFLATECRDDPNFPMQEVVVCLKAAPREDDPEILAFRKELDEYPNVRLVYYSNLEDLRPRLLECCTRWARSIIGNTGATLSGGSAGAVGG